MSVCSQIDLPLKHLILELLFPESCVAFQWFSFERGEKHEKCFFAPLPASSCSLQACTSAHKWGQSNSNGALNVNLPFCFFPLPFPTCPPSQELHSIQVSLPTFPFLLLTTSLHHILACQLMSHVIQDMLSDLLWCLSSTTSAFHFSFSHSLSHLDFYQLLSCLLHSPFLPNCCHYSYILS